MTHFFSANERVYIRHQVLLSEGERKKEQKKDREANFHFFEEIHRYESHPLKKDKKLSVNAPLLRQL